MKKEKINIKKLIKNLMSKDKYVRKAAVLSIIKYRGKEVLYLPGVVKNREEIFNIISDKRMVEPLIHTLKDEYTIVRKESAIALGVIGDKRAVEPLIHALRDKDIKVRCAAALALGEIGDKRATKPLIQAIKDENRDIRESVVKALGEIGDKRVVEQITNALYDYDVWVRKAATLALMKLDITMFLKIFETTEKIIKEASNGDIDLDYPLFFWEVGGVRPIIGELLIYKAVELTIQKLKDKDVDVREESAIALKHIGDERAVESLIRALRDEDKKVRCEAASALGDIGYKRAVEPLSQALKDKDRDVKESVIDALCYIYSNSAVNSALETLIQALKDKDKNIRRLSTQALGWIGDKKAVGPLIQALNDKDRDVRAEAAQSLGEIGNKRAEKPLIKALKDEHGYVRIHAAVALGKMGNNQGVETMIQDLKNKDKDVRSGAANALGHIKDERTVDPLINALKDIYIDVRENAIWSLGEIRDKRAVKSLIQMLEDEYSIVRISAANSLREIGDKRAIKPLLRVHKDDENKDVKNASEEALLWIFENGKYRRISNFDKLRENDRVEFKSSLRWDIKKNCVNKELQKSVAKTIAAFLNTNGGTLFIGVEDDCSINGIENDINSLKSKSIDDFEQSLIQVIVNYLGAKIIPDYIKIDYDKEEGKTICKVKVKRSLKAVFLKCKKRKYFYIRVGNTTRYLDVEETHSYIDEHFESVK